MNTHKIIAQGVITNLELNKKVLINDKHFIWGNLKPDMTSKYKLVKHYKDESFNLILNKIDYLSSLSFDDIRKWYPMSSFNQELGVICHFLCDFFCIPHYERWEFKHSMNKHIKYERELDLVAKEYLVKNEREIIVTGRTAKDFIDKLQVEYNSKKDYINDLEYASYVCNSIVNYILDNVIYNSNVIVFSAV
ncbi:zinc dependent phospholipase C family protein [Clostridium cavendishii]